MAKVTKRIHNSTDSFLGGGMGALIPIRDEQMKPLKKPSETEVPSSQQLNKQRIRREMEEAVMETFKNALPTSDPVDE